MKLDKMLTPPVKASVISFALVLAAASGARSEVATNVWIGAENGSDAWNDGNNWSLGHKPTVSEHAFITNQTKQTIQTPKYDMIIGRLTVSGANHSLSATGLYYSNYTGEDKDSLPAGTIIEVESGRTLSIGSNGRSDGDDLVVLNKLGGGTISNSGGMGGSSPYYRYKAINVYGGTLQMVTGNRNVRASKILIADGATFDMGGTENKLWSGCEIEVQAGGTFYCRLNNKIARLYGAGAVTGSGVLTLSLADGPCGFAGTLNKALVFDVAEYAAGVTEFICSNATVVTGRKYSAAEGTTLADVFKVSKGIGRITMPIADEPDHSLLYDDGGAVDYARYIASGKTYTHTADGDDHWTDPVFGEGTIVEKSSGVWTIDSLSLTGGTFQVSSDATGPGVKIVGGLCEDTTLSASKGNYDYEFGVQFKPLGNLNVANDRTFHQTAGDAVASPLRMGDGNGETTNEIAYFVSGGTFTSAPNSYYGMGLGLEASGTAVVNLNNGTYSGGVPHCITYQKSDHSHTVRVKDNATINAETLLFIYYKGAANNTATVDLVGNGLLSVSGTYAYGDNVPSSSSFVGQTVFDGGTIRSAVAGNTTWPTANPSNYDTMFRAVVKAGGGTIDVPRTNMTKSLTWRGPFMSGVDEGADGGLAKTGDGRLIFVRALDFTGPMKVRAGAVQVSEAPAAGHASLGYGGLEMDRGLVEFYPQSSDYTLAASSGVVRANGPSVVRLYTAETTLTIGAEGSDRPAFAFGPHGSLAFVLGVRAEQTPVDSLTNFHIRVNGTVPANTPLFAYYQPSSGAIASRRMGRYFYPVMRGEDGCLSELAYACSGSIPAADTEGAWLISGGGSRVLEKDLHVGMFHVIGGGHNSDSRDEVRRGGLQIAGGGTLVVGDGARGLVVLNNTYNVNASYGWARIFGEGTLDFGTAAGMFVASDCYGDDTDSSRQTAALVDCHLAGTGGVTFTSPTTQDSSKSADSLSGARMRAIHVGAANDYAGGTCIDNMMVIPGQPASLGTGTVTVVGDPNWGGELHFDGDYAGTAFANDIVVSGIGFKSTASKTLWGERAAISARNKSVKLTGAVTLAGDATVATSGTGGRLTFEGPIGGTGTLRVTSGTVVVKKEALAAYEAGRIVADEGAVLKAKYPSGLSVIIR